jgi:hypothetical protein
MVSVLRYSCANHIKFGLLPKAFLLFSGVPSPLAPHCSLSQTKQCNGYQRRSLTETDSGFFLGNNEWKMQKESRYYNWALVENRLKRISEVQASSNIHTMTRVLRSGTYTVEFLHGVC